MKKSNQKTSKARKIKMRKLGERNLARTRSRKTKKNHLQCRKSPKNTFLSRRNITKTVNHTMTSVR